MKYEILIRILFTLLQKEVVSATFLAEKFEISTRTVYRYIECLEMAYVPIERKSGRYGGFSIPESYRIPASFFTEKEVRAVQSALSALQADMPLPELESAYEKITSLEKHNIPTARYVVKNVVIDSGAWNESQGNRDKLALLGIASENNQKVKVSYHDRGGTFSDRVIHPYYLLMKQGVWYVYAYCELRKDFRLFKVGRIAYLSSVEENFAREAVQPPVLDFDLLRKEKIEFCLQVAPDAVHRVEDFLGVEQMQEKDGVVYFNGFLPDDDELVSEILQFGKGVKVVRPLALREKVKTAALEIALQNQTEK